MSEIPRLDIVTQLRDWCGAVHGGLNQHDPDECLFCGAAEAIEEHRTEIYDLARLATKRSERDVQMYVGRLAHRHRHNGLGDHLHKLITWRIGPVPR